MNTNYAFIKRKVKCAITKLRFGKHEYGPTNASVNMEQERKFDQCKRRFEEQERKFDRCKRRFEEQERKFDQCKRRF